jgi:chromate transport protein ChrA
MLPNGFPGPPSQLQGGATATVLKRTAKAVTAVVLFILPSLIFVSNDF